MQWRSVYAPRAWHDEVFYGLREPGPGEIALVHGNCQAESLRLLLDGGGVRTVRCPPVHELTPGDLPHLDAWLARADIVVSQPIHDDFGGLPVGTRQVLARTRARVVLVPVIRFAGLYPTHAIVRPPSDRSLVPPVVAYHDLRGLGAAAGLAVRDPTPADVRVIAERSLGELRAREAAHGTVEISDVFRRPSFALMRTLNHPGNPVWLELAARVRARLGLPEHVEDPGRPLLDSVHAPRAPAVIEAFGLDDAPCADWRVDGAAVDAETVRAAHAAWYAEHPDAVAAGLERHADTLALLT